MNYSPCKLDRDFKVRSTLGPIPTFVVAPVKRDFPWFFAGLVGVSCAVAFALPFIFG